MAIEDWIDYWEPDDERQYSFPCRFCGREVYWNAALRRKQTESGEIHQCSALRAKASEFPELQRSESL
jgi:hypothetical protein